MRRDQGYACVRGCGHLQARTRSVYIRRVTAEHSEILAFRAGLLKVVFSTETLAAGINMPARTTVISALSRRNDSGHVRLTHNQLLQMAGRAGRRGYDTAGALFLAARRGSRAHFCGLQSWGPPKRLCACMLQQRGCLTQHTDSCA